MGQPGFFDLNRRYEGLNEKNDPLVAAIRGDRPLCTRCAKSRVLGCSVASVLTPAHIYLCVDTRAVNAPHYCQLYKRSERLFAALKEALMPTVMITGTNRGLDSNSSNNMWPTAGGCSRPAAIQRRPIVSGSWRNARRAWSRL